MKVGYIILTGVALFYMSCQSRLEKKLGLLPVQLEGIVSDLQTMDIGDESELNYLLKMEELKSFVNELVSDYDICSINNHRIAIDFHFKCSRKSGRKANYGDKEYYLIKLLDLSKKGNILGFEQYVNCGKEPQGLNNDWYLIEKHINCD